MLWPAGPQFPDLTESATLQPVKLAYAKIPQTKTPKIT
jgi:hypothetical protein